MDKVNLDSLGLANIPSHLVLDKDKLEGQVNGVVDRELIALQINNWNNDRIERKLETNILSEILVNLEKDVINLNSKIKFNENKYKGIYEQFHKNNLNGNYILSEGSIKTWIRPHYRGSGIRIKKNVNLK